MFLLILRNLRYRRLRSYLTVLGIVIGSTLILSLLFLGDGLKRAVAAQLTQFGSDLIYVFPGKENNPFLGMFAGQTLRDKDVEIIKDVPGVELALIMNTATVKASAGGEEKSILLHGSPWRETKIVFTQSQGFSFSDGNFPEKDSANEVMIGGRVAQGRFGRNLSVGDELVIRGKKFFITGVLNMVGEPTTDSTVYTSLERFRLITGQRTGVNSLSVKVARGYEIDEVAVDMRAVLKKQKGIEDFVVLTSETAGRLIGDILSLMQIVISGIAAVALVVGGIGIMNTMYTSVLERTRDVGVLKALGATSKRILTMFLFESAAMGAIGGSLGLIIGGGLAKLVEYGVHKAGYALLQVEIQPMIVVGVFVFTSFVGMIFGIWPAWRAARLKPTEALRYE